MPTQTRTTTPKKDFSPPFADGDQMDRETFHALYLQTPKNFKAELISGVVHVASPVKLGHGLPDSLTQFWLSSYAAETPGVIVCANTTTIVNDDTEIQPDISMMILPEYGGKMRVTEDDFVGGPAELIVEISNSTLATDLTDKKDRYEAFGVVEYLVVNALNEKIHWFRQTQMRFQTLQPQNGIWKSEVFPGLWLSENGLFVTNSSPLIPTLKLGLASPEHAAFVAKLNAKTKKPKGKKR
jgi:Uma2 family endonuclease